MSATKPTTIESGGYHAENFRRRSRCVFVFICMAAAFVQSPSRAAWAMSWVSCGQILDSTEMTPMPPMTIMGTVSASSPEYTSRHQPFFSERMQL